MLGSPTFNEPRKKTMAKGQMRSNKETRKPKADKAKAVVPSTVPGKFAAAQTTGADKKK
jgi:hypothetical protein